VSRFPCPLTSAAVSAAPGCRGCLKLAGPQTILQGLWARARRAARNNSPSTAPAPRPRSAVQTSQPAQLESRQKPAGWGWAPRYEQQGTPGHNPSLGDVTFRHQVTSQSIAWRHLSPSLGEKRTHCSGHGDIRTHCFIFLHTWPLETSLKPPAPLCVCYGFAQQGFGSAEAIGVASVRSCWKLALCLIKPVPAGSKTDQPLPKAKAISDGGGASGITYFRKGRKQTLGETAVRERSKTM